MTVDAADEGYYEITIFSTLPLNPTPRDSDTNIKLTLSLVTDPCLTTRLTPVVTIQDMEFTIEYDSTAYEQTVPEI